MKLKDIVYPIITAVVLSYFSGCTRNEHARFQNLNREEQFDECMKSTNELNEKANREGWKFKKSFPDMNFSCERYSKKDDD